MAKADYYDLLGVDRGVDAERLKKAYRKAAMKYHPDRNPGDHEAEARFKELSEAYDALRDPEKRAAYDRFGHAAFEGGMAGGHSGFDFASSFADVFDDLFGEFMGGRRRDGGSRGSDLRYNLEISLEDAFQGITKQIRVPRSIGCEDCAGSGAAEGAQPITCPSCQGHGKVRAQQGFFTIERTCPTCGGAGRVIEKPCPRCGGQGRTHEEKTLSVTIPQGVEDGTRIRLSGEGDAGVRGGPPGDLYIFLSLKPHHLFKRDGRQIYCRVPIPMTTAALGGEVEVPTIDGGRARVGVPAGTQSGKQFRLRGKGMPPLHGQGAPNGDMYVQTLVEVPVNLSKRQKELLKEFQAAGKGGDNSPETEGFFAKVKEFWEDLTES